MSCPGTLQHVYSWSRDLNRQPKILLYQLSRSCPLILLIFHVVSEFSRQLIRLTPITILCTCLCKIVRYILKIDSRMKENVPHRSSVARFPTPQAPSSPHPPTHLHLKQHVQRHRVHTQRIITTLRDAQLNTAWTSGESDWAKYGYGWAVHPGQVAVDKWLHRLLHLHGPREYVQSLLMITTSHRQSDRNRKIRG